MHHELWRRGIKVRRLRPHATALGIAILALSLVSAWEAFAARKMRSSVHAPAPRAIPYPHLEFPVAISGSQYLPLSWREIPGWASDDHLQAYKAFRISCASIARQQNPVSDS